MSALGSTLRGSLKCHLGGTPGTAQARATLKQFVDAAETLALAPQVLNEFVHAVTDGKRFENPLSMNDAVAVAEGWWNADLVWRVFPALESVRLGFQWMRQYDLGRSESSTRSLPPRSIPTGLHAFSRATRGTIESLVASSWARQQRPIRQK